MGLGVAAVSASSTMDPPMRDHGRATNAMAKVFRQRKLALRKVISGRTTN